MVSFVTPLQMRQSASVISKILTIHLRGPELFSVDLLHVNQHFLEVQPSVVPMGMLQDPIRNTQWKAVLFQEALYHSKWTIGTGEPSQNGLLWGLSARLQND